jgi:hypothetical protein
MLRHVHHDLSTLRPTQRSPPVLRPTRQDPLAMISLLERHTFVENTGLEFISSF